MKIFRFPQLATIVTIINNPEAKSQFSKWLDLKKFRINYKTFKTSVNFSESPLKFSE